MLPLYDNIRRRRIELGMSQQELAEKAGYTDRSSIAKIESGKVDLTQSKIIALANALNIKPGQLMGWTEPENQMLWRNTTIENGKIVRKFRGLVDGENIDKALLFEQDLPLQFDFPSELPLEINDKALCFALWEGDSEIVDEEMIEDVKAFAKLLADKKKRKMEQK